MRLSDTTIEALSGYLIGFVMVIGVIFIIGYAMFLNHEKFLLKNEKGIECEIK